MRVDLAQPGAPAPRVSPRRGTLLMQRHARSWASAECGCGARKVCHAGNSSGEWLDTTSEGVVQRVPRTLSNWITSTARVTQQAVRWERPLHDHGRMDVIGTLRWILRLARQQARVEAAM